MKKATVHARTLQRACDALGGVQPLARRLNIAEHELAPWLDGSEQPPAEIFLTALEVVLEHSKARGTTWGASRQTRGDA